MAPKKDYDFDWEKYMGDKEYLKAPSEAFFQNPELPKNLFQVGKKVAIQDPRIPDSKCLGRIITVDKIWICVSLEGEKFAEYWLNCDDETLFPLEDTLKEGPLVPPKNFEGEPSKYMEFVDLRLQYDEEKEEDPRAPADWFHKISSEFKPKESLFKAGMKLEVPDLKRFKDELYPATVRAVNGNIVTVGFDGWGKKFDMTDTYECRFFYPVGTAKRIGARLVPPPSHAKEKPTPKTPKTKTPKKGAEKKENGDAESPASSKATPTSKTIPTKTPRRSAAVTPSKKSTPLKPAGRREDRKRSATESSSEPDEKKPKLDERKYVPSLADALAKTAPSSTKKKHTSPVKKRKPAILEDHHPPTPSEIVLLPAKDIKPADLVFQFFVNPKCYRSDLLAHDRVARLHPKFGPGNIHHIMREFLQQVVDVSSKPNEIIKAIPTKSPNILGVYAVIDGLEHAKFLPVARNIDHAWNIMTELFDKLKFCSNFITRTPKNCTSCTFNRTPSNHKTKPSSVVNPIKQDTEASSSSAIPTMPKSIKEWNVNQLCTQIAKIVPYSVVHSFRDHEIDGKAAVLLDEDTLITMLRIPPNHATKLMAFIDSKSEEA